MATQHNEDVITSFNTFRRTNKKEHVVKTNTEVLLKPRRKLIMDNSVDADIIGIEGQDNIDYDYTT